MLSRFDAPARPSHDPRDVLDPDPTVEVVTWEIEPLDADSHLGVYAFVPVAEAELWGQQAANNLVEPDELVDACRELLTENLDKARNTIGAASLREWEKELKGLLAWACENYIPVRGPFRTYANALIRIAWRRTCERITWTALGREKADQDRRLAAATDPAALAVYLEHVRTETVAWIALVRRRRREWVRNDARCQDQVYAVVLRVLELLRADDPLVAFLQYERVGLPALYQVRDEVLGQLRRRRRVQAFHVSTNVVYANIPRPDQALLEKQIWRNINDSVDAFLRARLTRAQSRYLNALLIELELKPHLWGIQERVAIRTGRGKSRVSEAMSIIRSIAEAADLNELIRDAAGERS